MAFERRPEAIMIVDPRSFRGFCFRGEGRRNLVISAKNDEEDLRIVWRLTKDKRARVVSLQTNSEHLIKYLRKFILPFFHSSFLFEPKLIKIHFEHLIHIAKIPLLEHNVKIDSFYELCDSIRHPVSLFPLDYHSKTVLGVYHEEWNLENVIPLLEHEPFISVLQMPDATRIPKRIFNSLVMYGPTITVEIKPKQGFYQKHPNIDIPYCNNCILQLEKCQSKSFKRMYDYCPLELYSGDFHRMMRSVSALFREPHRNLRIFNDGDCVYEDHGNLSALRSLELSMFPDQDPGSINILYSVLCHALAGVSASDGPFFLHDDSILATLLRAQRLDSIGIVRAREIYERLSESVKEELMDEFNILEKKDLKFTFACDDRSLLERYFLAATMKDCSLMVNIRLVRGPTVWTDVSPSRKLIRIETDTVPLYFAVHIQVVDLDPKLPQNLLSAFNRFMAGVEVVNKHPGLHKPCFIP